MPRQREAMNEIDDLVGIGMELPLMELDPAVGISYTHIKKHLRLWEKKNMNKAWMEAKNCKQTKVLVGEEPNGWTATLMRLSKWEAKTWWV